MNRTRLQLVHSLRPERIDAGIVPDVGAVAPVLAELEVVEVRGRSRFPHKDELVFGAIEGSHSAVGLIPDAEVFQFGIHGMSGGEHFLHPRRHRGRCGVLDACGGRACPPKKSSSGRRGCSA